MIDPNMTTEVEAEHRRGGFWQLLGDGAAYGAGPMLARVLGFLTLPFVAQSLGTNEFGTLELYSSVASALAALLLLGLDSSMLAIFTTSGESDRGHRSVFSSALAVETTLALVVTLGVVVFREPIATLLSGRADDGRLLVPVAGFVLAMGFGNVARAALRATSRPGRYLMSTCAAAVASTIALIVALVVSASPRTVLIAQASGAGVGALVGLFGSAALFTRMPRRDVSRALVRHGLPQGVSVAALVAADVGHRWWLLRVEGSEAVGVLGLAVRLAVVVAFVSLSFQTAWYPRAIELHNSDAARSLIARDAERIVTLVGLAAVAFAALSPEVIDIVGAEDFSRSREPVGWLMVAAIGAAGVQVLMLSNVFARQFGALGVASVLGVVVGLGCAIVTVPTFGVPATAFSMAIGQWVTLSFLSMRNREEGIALLRLRPLLVPMALPALAAVLITSLEFTLVIRLLAVGVVSGWACYLVLGQRSPES